MVAGSTVEKRRNLVGERRSACHHPPLCNCFVDEPNAAAQGEFQVPYPRQVLTRPTTP